MHASVFSEPGAFRMALAIVMAAAVAVAAGLLIAPAVGIALAVVGVVAGIAFETHHLVE